MSRQLTFTLMLLLPIMLLAQQPGAPVDTELLQSKIMLIDATLDLNQALLQGVNVSLDSLNVKDKGVIDEKNVQATIRSIKRRRDKALLTPSLMHMRDSLQTEITHEQDERVKLQYILTGTEPKPVRPDTSAVAIVKKDTVPVPVVKDTIITPAAPEPEARQANEPVAEHNNLPVPPVPEPEPNPAVQPVKAAVIPPVAGVLPPVRHWPTARAVYAKEDTITEAPVENEPATTDAQIVQNGTDTGGYIPSVPKTAEGGNLIISDSVRLLKAELFLTRARKAANEKNYKTAVEYLQKSIDLMPGYYDAWFDLGETDARRGFYTKALNEFKTCAGIDSSRAVLFYKMGELQIKLKHRDVAPAYFIKSLALDSNYVPAIMDRGLMFAEGKDYTTAITLYSHALRIDPGHHLAYKARGVAEYHLKNYDAAIDDFTRFLIFDETDGSSYYYRGLSRIARQQNDEGCDDLTFSSKFGYPAAIKAMIVHCN